MIELIVPATAASMVVGGITVTRWKRFCRTGAKPRLQFFLSDYLFSISAIAVALLAVRYAESLWYGEHASLIVVGAVIVGLFNGKLWSLTRSNKSSTRPDWVYLVIAAGAVATPAMVSLLTAHSYVNLAIVPITITFAILAILTLIQWNRFLPHENTKVNFHFDFPDLVVCVLCIVLTIFIIHGFRFGSDESLFLMLFVPSATAGAVCGKLCCLTLRCSPQRCDALYVGVGALTGCATGFLSAWGYLICIFRH